MKSKFAVSIIGAVLCLMWAGSASAQTTVPGGNIVNQTWTKAKSPYIVQGDVTVPDGASLTIEAGVEVQFPGGDNMGAGEYLDQTEFKIDGALSVNGTAAEPVRLVGTGSSAGQRAQWFGFQIGPSATQASFEHVEIRNANVGIRNHSVGTALQVSDTHITATSSAVAIYAGDVTLQRLIVDDCDQGVYSSGDASVHLVNSIIRRTNDAVWLSLINGASPSHDIVNCTITDNANRGIHFQIGSGTTGQATVVNSIVTNNGLFGIDASRASTGLVDVSYADVWGNGTDFNRVDDTGAGNISLNPLFTNGPDDVTLGSTSPCIDAGTATGAPSADIDGKVRPIDGDGINGVEVDMGAYEYGTPPVCGDGHRDAGEECDDGNTVDGDGCSSTCTIETGGDVGADAGTDAGVDVGPDVGVDVGLDTGMDAAADSGVDATSDTGSNYQPEVGGSDPIPDVGQHASDDIGLADAGTDATADTRGGSSSGASDEGCSCTSTDGGPSPAAGMYLLFVVAGLAALRRRRREH